MRQATVFVHGLLFDPEHRQQFFSETSVDFYKTKQRHILQYSVLHIYCFDNLKFNVFIISFYVKVIHTVSFITKSLSLQLT